MGLVGTQLQRRAPTRIDPVPPSLHGTDQTTEAADPPPCTPQPTFDQWQLTYFGCTNCSQAGGGADPDDDGLINTNEYLAGTVPTNNASVFRVISITRPTLSDINLTWTTVGGHSYAVQTNRPPANGNYTNNFSDLTGLLLAPGVGESTMSYTNVGGATSTPARYYRVRTVPVTCP